MRHVSSCGLLIGVVAWRCGFFGVAVVAAAAAAAAASLASLVSWPRFISFGLVSPTSSVVLISAAWAFGLLRGR